MGDGGGRTHRACRLLILPSMSRCPAEYCSMTSFTSYGRSVSLNFLLATRNFRILSGEGVSEGRNSFPAPLSVPSPRPVQHQGSSCLGHREQPLLGLPASLPTKHTLPGPAPSRRFVCYSLMCLFLQSRQPRRAGTGSGCSLLGGTLLLRTACRKTFLHLLSKCLLA